MENTIPLLLLASYTSVMGILTIQYISHTFVTQLREATCIVTHIPQCKTQMQMS